MKILLVHGVSHCELNPNYYAPWKAAIGSGLKAAGLRENPEFVEFLYDDLFQQHPIQVATYAAAVAELAASAVEHSVLEPVEDWIGGILHPSRDLAGLGDDVRWRAGMVAQLVVDASLRRDLSDRLDALLDREQPDVLAAHSLGSLLTYDYLHNDPRARRCRDMTYVTFGSQINNIFVRSELWPGRMTVPGVRRWFHLYNRYDPVLTADIAIPDAPAFRQILTPSKAGHAPVTGEEPRGYLDHQQTQLAVWPALAAPPAQRELKHSRAVASQAFGKPRRRALLIGINEYPDPAHRLSGCVNDTFLMSAFLQEYGFRAADIRLLLNERATAAAIRERLAWLFEGAHDGTERVLFYSGHGAQLPGYSAAETVDHSDECLVPYDFAWTRETAITDDDFFKLYSDLPFSAHFIGILDCCHAGGMTREGANKVRGITAPDDIRHRMLQWNAREQMWEQRPLPGISTKYGGTADHRRAMMGKDGSAFRLGRGMRLRRHLTAKTEERLVAGRQGLYLPVLFEACGEEEKASEYRHGVESFGAFTYSLVKNLRSHPTFTYRQLRERTARTLRSLGYEQRPELVGPTSVLKARVLGR